MRSLCICQEVFRLFFMCSCVHVCCESIASEHILKVWNRTSIWNQPAACLLQHVVGNFPWQILGLFHKLNKCQNEKQKVKPAQLGSAAQLQSLSSPWFWAFIMQLALSTLLFKAELKVELNSWRSEPFSVMQNYGEGDGTGQEEEHC